MADFTPMGNQGTPANPLGFLSSVLGVKQQIQALQGQAAQVQQEKVKAQEAQGVNDFFTNWHPGEHSAGDGTTDIASAMDSDQFAAIPGVARAAVVDRLNAIKGKQIENMRGLMGMGAEGLAGVAPMVGALRNDPHVIAGDDAGRAAVRSAMDNAMQVFGPAGAKALMPYKGIADGPLKKGELSQRLQSLIQQGMTASQLLAAQTATASPIQTTGGVQQVNVNPNAPQPVGSPMGAPTPNAAPPQIVTAPNQQVATTTPGGGIRALSETRPNAPINLTGTEKIAQFGQAEGVSGRIQQAISQANNTVQSQDALTRARALLASPEAPNTGAGFNERRALMNFLSTVGYDTKGADDMNTLTKNLARYEASRATAAGLGGTDAARELAHNGSPNTQLDNSALSGIVDQSLATEKAIATYAKVQSKTADPKQQLKNETDFRSIPIIQAHEYGMSRNANEANAKLAKFGMSAADMAKARAALKEFEGR